MTMLRPAILPLALACAATPALAQTAPEVPERTGTPVAPADAEGLVSFAGLRVSANVAVVSEYRFRGVRLSRGNPALQGGVDIDHVSGFYAGAFASTLSERTLGYGGTELDLYAGWTGPVGAGLTGDIGVIAYLYPDAGPGAGAAGGGPGWTELYGSVTYSLGPASLRVGGAWDLGKDGIAFAGPDGGGLIRDNLYVYTDLRVGIPGTRLSATALAGHTTGWRSGAEGPEWNWSLGAEMPLPVSLALPLPLSVGVAYVDAGGGRFEPVAANGFNPLGGSVVGTLRASF